MLFRSGVTTYAELARLTPKRLVELLGPQPAPVDARRILGDAARLAQAPEGKP